MIKTFSKMILVISGLVFVTSCDLMPSNNADVTAPVITLAGNASISINEGDVYTEQGATASDDVDGDLTSDIDVSGSVDVEVPGTYEITYNVQDAAGNSAVTLTRTITVVNVQEFSQWNSATSQWDAFAYALPAGTINVANNADGTQIIAWTNTGALYLFDNVDNWDLQAFSVPTDTDNLIFFSEINIIYSKTDRTLWNIASGTTTTFDDKVLPVGSIDMLPASGLYAVLGDGSVSHYDTVDPDWNDVGVSLPSNMIEIMVGNVGTINYIRLDDNRLYNYDDTTDTLTSLNVTVPAETVSAIYFNGDYLALH